MEKMINWIAKKLASNSEYSEEIMAFCVKLWLSTISQTIFLFIVSMLLFDFKIFLSFVIVFCTLRSIIEGYHCKTFLRCFLLTDIMFFAVVGVSYISSNIRMCGIFGIILMFVSMVGLLYECKKAFGKTNIRSVIYGYLRYIIVLVMWGFIMYQLYSIGLNNNALWVMSYSYSLAYILVVVNKLF